MNGVYLCPADLIGCRTNQIRIEETTSKLVELNRMMAGLTQYYKKVNEVRNEIFRLSIKEFANKSSFRKFKYRYVAGKDIQKKLCICTHW